ncbi:MAG: hypothetical protein JKY09_04805 [Crocinitomicaceae bacterium]|nr:hypothetical protein [Crocinitomicaceae bacterium]
MNRFTNALLLFFLLPTMLVTIYIGFDLPLGFIKTSGANLPYRTELFLGLSLVFFVINLRRSVRRWIGLKIVNKQTKFKWSQPVSKSRKQRIITYLTLEAFVMAFVAIALYTLTEEAWAIALSFLLVVVDNLIFGMVSKKYRVSLSSKALIVADREVIVLYFTGLRKVSIQQQTVFFDYIKNIQLTFPLDCIQEGMKEEFFEILENQLDRDKVFFSKIK